MSVILEGGSKHDWTTGDMIRIGACHDIAGLGRVRRCVAVGIYHVAVHIAAVIAQLRATVCKQALEFDNVCKPA